MGGPTTGGCIGGDDAVEGGEDWRATSDVRRASDHVVGAGGKAPSRLRGRTRFVRGRRFGREVPARWQWFPSVPPATTVAYYCSLYCTYSVRPVQLGGES